MNHEEPSNEELGIKPCRGCLFAIMGVVGLVELGLLIWWLA